MPVLVYTAHIAPEHVEAVEAAGRRVFAAVRATRPEGFRYAVVRLGEATYVTLLEIPDGGRNPLRDVPEYAAFEAALPGWLAEPSTGGPAAPIGSYRMFDAG